MPLIEFTPRQFEEILQDMVNMVRTIAPRLTDWNVGSIIRTILEVAALEDDEQYTQMVYLSLLWNLDNVVGRDLDERLLERNIQRLGPLYAAGEVEVSNGNLITTFLTQPVSVAAAGASVLSSAGFPTSGYPYTIRVGEGLSTQEDRSVTANDTSGNVFTTDAFVNDHKAGERVSIVEGGNLTAPAGTRVRVRPEDNQPELSATLLEPAVVQAGNYTSNPALAQMDSPGLVGNVDKDTIKEFVGSPPFDQALVTNIERFTGGRNSESDDQFRSRGKKKFQSLGRGTPLSVEELVIGIEYTELTDGRTWRVISAKKQEHFGQGCADTVDLYVWAGAFDFLSLASIPSAETLTGAAEDGQKLFRLANIAVVPGSLVLERYPVGGTGWEVINKDVDYYFNEGRGEIEIAAPGLNKGDQLQARQYDYYTGLLQRVQTVLNGVERNPNTYPGVAPVGVKVLATFPRPKRMNDIRLSIQVRDGFTEEQVAPEVRSAISRYLSELKVGDDVVLNEMIERAMATPGMFDLTFISPTQNITLLEDEILDLEDVDIIVS